MEVSLVETGQTFHRSKCYSNIFLFAAVIDPAVCTPVVGCKVLPIVALWCGAGANDTVDARQVGLSAQHCSTCFGLCGKPACVVSGKCEACCQHCARAKLLCCRAQGRGFDPHCCSSCGGEKKRMPLCRLKIPRWAKVIRSPSTLRRTS